MAKLTWILLLLPSIALAEIKVCTNARAISILSPGSTWRMRNDDLSTLEWISGSRPSDLTIKTAVSDCLSGNDNDYHRFPPNSILVSSGMNHLAFGNFRYDGSTVNARGAGGIVNRYGIYSGSITTPILAADSATLGSAGNAVLISSNLVAGATIFASGTIQARNISEIFTVRTDSVTIGTTSANSPLTKPVLAGSTYYFDCYILFQTTTTTTGFALSVRTPAAVGGIFYTAEIPIAADGTGGAFQGWGTSSNDRIVGTGVQAANTTYVASLRGVLMNGANAGDLTVAFSSELNGTPQAIMKAGSMCTILTNPASP